MVFYNAEVPVAASMVALADRLGPPVIPPFQVFCCYWMAFNNIYVTVNDRRGGRRVTRRTLKDGSVRTRTIGHVTIPEVDAPGERAQIDAAFAEFSDDLKDQLIEHPSVHFFVYRTPSWHGQRIERDLTGQRLNGVLNVGYTTDVDHPVWSPIDTPAYERYVAGQRDAATRDALAKQILNLLYTVRNNTFHGGKGADDANDLQVVDQALPLLQIVVKSFLAV